MIRNITLLAVGMYSGFFLNNLKAQENPCFQFHCPISEQYVFDESNNDSQLWNSAEWWDVESEIHDLSEAEIDIGLYITEVCDEPYQVSCKLLLDLNGDDIPETIINPKYEADMPAGKVPFNNYPNLSHFEWRTFDQRGLTPEQTYRFALRKIENGDEVLYQIGWSTKENPEQLVPLQLPPGRHQIRWSVSGGSWGKTCTIQVDANSKKQ